MSSDTTLHKGIECTMVKYVYYVSSSMHIDIKFVGDFSYFDFECCVKLENGVHSALHSSPSS